MYRATTPRLVRLASLMACGAVLACSERSSVLDVHPSFAPGSKGSGGGGSKNDIKVSAVDPAYGEQGQIIYGVRISGSGFDATAEALWELDGVPAAGVRVLATRYVSGSTVEADIEIAEQADLNLYDVSVSVAVPGGRKRGVGIDLFQVKGKPTGPVDPTATWVISTNSTLGLQGDGGGAYVNGQCEVATRIYSTAQGSNSGDATMTLSFARGKGCDRRVRLNYPDGKSESVRAFINLRDMHNAYDPVTGAFVTIPIGETALRTLAVRPDVVSQTSRCGRVLFGLGDQGAGVGTDRVVVHRVSRNEFRVTSQPGLAKALCEAEGTIMEMRVDFVIVADTDLQ